MGIYIEAALELMKEAGGRRRSVARKAHKARREEREAKTNALEAEQAAAKRPKSIIYGEKEMAEAADAAKANVPESFREGIDKNKPKGHATPKADVTYGIDTADRFREAEKQKPVTQKLSLDPEAGNTLDKARASFPKKLSLLAEHQKELDPGRFGPPKPVDTNFTLAPGQVSDRSTPIRRVLTKIPMGPMGPIRDVTKPLVPEFTPENSVTSSGPAGPLSNVTNKAPVAPTGTVPPVVSFMKSPLGWAKRNPEGAVLGLAGAGLAGGAGLYGLYHMYANRKLKERQAAKAGLNKGTLKAAMHKLSETAPAAPTAPSAASALPTPQAAGSMPPNVPNAPQQAESSTSDMTTNNGKTVTTSGQPPPPLAGSWRGDAAANLRSAQGGGGEQGGQEQGGQEQGGQY